MHDRFARAIVQEKFSRHSGKRVHANRLGNFCNAILDARPTGRKQRDHIRRLHLDAMMFEQLERFAENTFDKRLIQ